MKSVLAIIFLIITGLLTNGNGWALDCSLNVSTPSGQVNHVITNSEVLNCTEANIFWNYPMNNLTIVFSAPELKPFQFCLINSDSIYYDILVYHVENNQETKVIKSKNKVCMKSNTGNTITLKLAAPTQMKYYGVFVDYTIN